MEPRQHTLDRRRRAAGRGACCCGLQVRHDGAAGARRRIDATSVSGLSAGAYMAGQFQIAHSSIVRGAGIVAGGPYGCAESAFADVMPGPGAPFLNLSKAINGCMLDAMQAWGVPDPEKLAERARKLAQSGPHRRHRRPGARPRLPVQRHQRPRRAAVDRGGGGQALCGAGRAGCRR